MQNVVSIIIDNCYYKERILGLTTTQWLINKINNNYMVLNSEEEIKEQTLNNKYALVLFSSFPLIKQEDILNLIDYAVSKELTFCDFNGGYIIKTEYINKKPEKILSNSINFDYNIQLTDNFSLNKITQELQKLILNSHLNNGVLFTNSSNVIIDATVKLGKGVVIGNNCELYGNTQIDQNGQVLSNSVLNNVIVQENVKITYSYLEDCEVKSGAVVGPFSRIRKGVEIGSNCKIGNFVELKQAKIEKNTKISHLTYVGDAEIGENTNIGCGVVFCNYDGRNKHKTKIGKDCFIGSNVNLVAPLDIGDNCFIACGSTITKQIKNNIFAIQTRDIKIKDNKFKK